MRHRLCFLLLAGLIFSSAFPQTAAPVRDPNAVALAARSLQAMAGITALKDITIQAKATYIAGSDQEIGPATLIASGNQQSLVTLSLTNGPRQEVRNGFAGAWSGVDQIPQLMAPHNCWSDANWFFPSLTLQALQADPTLGVLYQGPASWSGHAVLHLQFFHTIPGLSSSLLAQAQTVSAMDLLVDPQSLLPLSLSFNLHPDDDLNIGIPVQVLFSDYRLQGGVLVAFHIQKYVQGTLTLDLQVSSATVNSGVPQSEFVIPPTAGGLS